MNPETAGSVVGVIFFVAIIAFIVLKKKEKKDGVSPVDRVKKAVPFFKDD